MDYKEEYQKALERAKKGMPMDDVFPELKESDDEKMRKELLEYAKDEIRSYNNMVSGDYDSRDKEDKKMHEWWKKVVAYLEKQKELDKCPEPCVMSNCIGCSIYEKQKEQKITECTSDSVLQKIKIAITSCRELSEHYKDTKENFHQYYGGKADGLRLALAYFGNKNELTELKPAEWSEEDKKNIEKLDGFLSEVFCFGHVNVSQKDKEELQSWLKFLPERFNLQPKQEWGEGEIKLLNSIINDYEEAAKSFCGYDVNILFLKAIRDGEYDLSKQEWSEEDKQVLQFSIDWLNTYRDRHVISQEAKDEITFCIEKLKSLCPQPHWKPSEEQMKCLDDCVNRAREIYNTSNSGYDAYPTLKSLYNDLKKLI